MAHRIPYLSIVKPKIDRKDALPGNGGRVKSAILDAVILHSHKARALALIGIIFVFVGLANFTTYHELSPASRVAYEGQFTLFSDLRVWGCFFALAGVVGIVAAYTKKYSIGFFAMMLMSTWWGALFAVGLVLSGYTRIIPSILTWILISGFLYIISSWPEFPDKTLVKEEHLREE
jgi:hypothetical protein